MPPMHRLTLRGVDVRSVVRVSVVMYACVLLVFVIAWAILWTVAALFGVTGNVEDFIAKLFALDSFSFSLIAQAIAIVDRRQRARSPSGPVPTRSAATFYNLIVEVQGGIQIDVEVDDG